MSDERKITFRCTFQEADKLFDLLHRLLEALWDVYDSDFTEQARLEACLQNYTEPDKPVEYYDDDIPF